MGWVEGLCHSWVLLGFFFLGGGRGVGASDLFPVCVLLPMHFSFLFDLNKDGKMLTVFLWYQSGRAGGNSALSFPV